MLKSLKELNGTQMTGLMLAVGIATVFLSGIFTPSVLIIDMVLGTDLTTWRTCSSPRSRTPMQPSSPAPSTCSATCSFWEG